MNPEAPDEGENGTLQNADNKEILQKGKPNLAIKEWKEAIDNFFKNNLP